MLQITILNNKKETQRKLFYTATFVKNYIDHYNLYNIFKNPLFSMICLKK